MKERHLSLLLSVGSIGVVSSCGGTEPCIEAATPLERLSLGEAFGVCNHRPEADVQGPRSVPKRTTVMLDGTSSYDPDGTELLHRWQLIEHPPSSASAFVNPDAPRSSIELDLTGTYRIELVVSDGELESEPSGLLIEATNRAPSVELGPDIFAARGDRIQLSAESSSDPEGDELRFDWRLELAPAGSQRMLEDVSSMVASLDLDVRGVFEISLAVSDGEAESPRDSFRVLAGVSATPPVAVIVAPRTATVSDSIVFDGTSSRDEDGDALAFGWRILSRPRDSFATFTSSTTEQAVLVPDQAGRWHIELSVTDGYYSASDDVEINVFRNPVLQGADVFEPSSVYFTGALVEGVGFSPFLCSVEDPNTPSVGFTPFHEPGIISPDGGGYVYLHRLPNNATGELRRFVAEPLRLDPTTGAWIYPSSVTDNDPVVPTLACPGDVVSFMMEPISGRLVYYCLSQAGWFDDTGAEVQVCTTENGPPDIPLALAIDGSMLCTRSIRDASGTSHPLAAASSFNWRAHGGGGFWLLHRDQSTGRFLRLRAHTDGNVELEQEYGLPDSPDVLSLSDDQRGTMIDGFGHLYVRGIALDSEGVPRDLMVRLPADGSPGEIVYDERTAPLCLMDVVTFISGP